MRAFVLINPISGRGRAAEVGDAACGRLREAGHAVERVDTRPVEGATQVAAEIADHADLIVVAGGDGTLRETVVGLGDAASRIRLVLIPLGNANVIARELGIPLDPSAALAVIESTASRRLDVGEVTLTREDGSRESLAFLAMVGVGYDAFVVRRIDRLRKSRFGSRWYALWADSVYFFAGLLAAFQRQPRDLRLDVDSSALDGRFRAALLCNARTYSKGWSMTPRASSNDGQLDLQARKRSLFPWLAIHLLAAMFSRRAPAFVSDYASGRALRVRGNRGLPVQVDGDDRGDACDIQVQLRAAGISIAVPAASPTPAACGETEAA